MRFLSRIKRSTNLSLELIQYINKFKFIYKKKLVKETKRQKMIRTFYYYYYRYSALGPVWAETRAQSVDWYSSGTLHPGQVLRGSLPLLSPTYILSSKNKTKSMCQVTNKESENSSLNNCSIHL